MPPALPDFAAAADALRRQELARLTDAVPTTLEALRSLTPPSFRTEIALMVERLGHTIVTDPASPNLVTIKDGRKTVIACARPADPTPTGSRDLARVHDAVIVANAQTDIYVTTRGFTPDALAFATSLPIIQLVDGKKLGAALKRNKGDNAPPETYKAMCRQCGDVVQHRLDKPKLMPCSTGHLVPPTIAPATIAPRKSAAYGEGDAPTPRPLTRREMRAHNHGCTPGDQEATPTGAQ